MQSMCNFFRTQLAPRTNSNFRNILVRISKYLDMEYKTRDAKIDSNKKILVEWLYRKVVLQMDT